MPAAFAFSPGTPETGSLGLDSETFTIPSITSLGNRIPNITSQAYTDSSPIINCTDIPIVELKDIFLMYAPLIPVGLAFLITSI